VTCDWTQKDNAAESRNSLKRTSVDVSPTGSGKVLGHDDRRPRSSLNTPDEARHRSKRYRQLLVVWSQCSVVLCPDTGWPEK